MVIADIIVLCILILSAGFGAYVGFGKGLEVVSKGVLGWIMTIVACYFLLGFATEIPFVQDMMRSIVTSLQGYDAWWSNALLFIRIDIVAVSAIVYVVVVVIKVIIVQCTKNAMEIDNKFVMVINRIGGMILFLAYAIAIGLLVFQILTWIGGGTAESVANGLSGSFLGLDTVFLNNPLNSFIKMVNII